jgi:hypothetical protein
MLDIDHRPDRDLLATFLPAGSARRGRSMLAT